MRKRNETYVAPVIPARERDYQLAQDALQGERTAWDTLYQDALPFVRQRIKAYDDQNLFASSDYSDITDEAFRLCYEHLARYQGLSRFQSWVLGYAKNIMRNRKRRQRTVRINRYLLQCMEQSRAIYLDPLYIIIRVERNQHLWAAFFQLSPTDRTILYRRLFFNTPPRELAKELQLTRKQVLQRYDDALLVVRWHFLRSYR